MVDNTTPRTGRKASRRTILSATSVAVAAGLAGCSALDDGSDSDSEDADTESEDDTTDGNDAEESDGSEEDGEEEEEEEEDEETEETEEEEENEEEEEEEEDETYNSLSEVPEEELEFDWEDLPDDWEILEAEEGDDTVHHSENEWVGDPVFMELHETPEQAQEGLEDTKEWAEGEEADYEGADKAFVSPQPDGNITYFGIAYKEFEGTVVGAKFGDDGVEPSEDAGRAVIGIWFDQVKEAEEELVA